MQGFASGCSESFLEACKAEDKPAAQVIREFMRAYVRQHEEATEEDAGRTRSSDGLSERFE